MSEKLGGLTGREREIFRFVHRYGPVTKNGMTQTLHLKLSTLNRAMDVLEARELLLKSGQSDSSGGRKPLEYDVARDGVYCVGADISRTYVQTVLVNLKNEVLAQERQPMESGTTPRECAALLAGDVERMCTARGVQKSGILGIGVGTVGPMDRAQGVLLHPKGFLNPQWEERVPLKSLIREATGLPCAVDNGANAAALLEYYFGAGRGRRSIAYIHCGVGVRSAVIRDGAILRTMNDREDAFARMAVDPDGRRLEDYVSLQAIRNRCAKETGEGLPYEELLSRASRGDQSIAMELLKSVGMLGMAVSNLAGLLDPELVILSGPLVSGFEPYYNACTNAFRRQSDGGNRVAFCRGGGVKDAAVAVGAALILIEQQLQG